MASTYVNDIRLNEMAKGDASGTWGTVKKKGNIINYTEK